MNIFIKKDDVEKYEKLTLDAIDYKEIISTIPEDSTSEPNPEFLKMGRREWRWRVLEFDENDKKMEISYYDPTNKKRYYLNKTGKWIEKDIPDTYDKLVTKVNYYYPQS